MSFPTPAPVLEDVDDPMYHWVTVSISEHGKDNDRVERMMVPGGWLYRNILVWTDLLENKQHLSTSLVFHSYGHSNG